MKEFINRAINFFLMVRSWLYWKLEIFPDTQNAEAKITKKGYRITKEFSPEETFRKVRQDNWGSARGGSKTVISEKNVILTGRQITIKTEIGRTKGLDWDGNPVWRGYSTGEVRSKEHMEPKGIYSARININFTNYGSWDSFWFYSPIPEGNYEEVDAFERFYDKKNRYNKLTSSVHTDFQTVCTKPIREMYSGDYFTPSEEFVISIEFGKKIKVYCNGLLVFVGLKWMPEKNFEMIFGSAIKNTAKDTVVFGNMIARPYFYKISEIKHYSNE